VISSPSRKQTTGARRNPGATEAPASRILGVPLVLCDLVMPRMDGYEIARRARRIPECAHARLVALTALREDTAYVRSWSAGFVRDPDLRPAGLGPRGPRLAPLNRGAGAAIAGHRLTTDATGQRMSRSQASPASVISSRPGRLKAWHRDRRGKGGALPGVNSDAGQRGAAPTTSNRTPGTPAARDRAPSAGAGEAMEPPRRGFRRS
jgi:CheY-like chemotaxis protein